VSDYSDEGYDDEGNEANGPKALRDALKKERKEKTDALKRLTDLEAKLTEYDKASRATTLNEALKTAGVKDAAKVAKLYPSGDETTAEAVAKWVAEYKDVLNISTAPEGKEPLDEESGGDRKDAPLDPAVQHYLEVQGRGRELETERTEGPMTDERLATAFAEIEKNAKTPEEITAGLRALGATVRGGYDR
jgi:hypothetical protein